MPRATCVGTVREQPQWRPLQLQLSFQMLMPRELQSGRTADSMTWQTCEGGRPQRLLGDARAQQDLVGVEWRDVVCRDSRLPLPGCAVAAANAAAQPARAAPPETPDGLSTVVPPTARGVRPSRSSCTNASWRGEFTALSVLSTRGARQRLTSRSNSMLDIRGMGLRDVPRPTLLSYFRVERGMAQPDRFRQKCQTADKKSTRGSTSQHAAVQKWRLTHPFQRIVTPG
jgi:hypothetical protein